MNIRNLKLAEGLRFRAYGRGITAKTVLVYTTLVGEVSGSVIIGLENKKPPVRRLFI
ncbi:hypothetical protein BH09PAT4_BH09PAT4_03360 [soil metagenome]